MVAGSSGRVASIRSGRTPRTIEGVQYRGIGRSRTSPRCGSVSSWGFPRRRIDDKTRAPDIPSPFRPPTEKRGRESLILVPLPSPANPGEDQRALFEQLDEFPGFLVKIVLFRHSVTPAWPISSSTAGSAFRTSAMASTKGSTAPAGTSHPLTPPRSTRGDRRCRW